MNELKLADTASHTPSTEYRTVDAATYQSLYRSGYTPGLVELLATHTQHFAARIWILDNSGSMAIGDGYRIVETSDQRTEGQTVTRWEELTQMVIQQAELAASLKLFTEFRFLNHSGPLAGEQTFTVGHGKRVQQEIIHARNLMLKSKPTGTSPIQFPLRIVAERIREMRNELEVSGRRVALVIVTDGVPTDEDGSETNPEAKDDFMDALRRLEGLPVWVVVRLCTSEKRVVDYWNNLDVDAGFDLQLEVLDDHLSEAKEVTRHNRWLNYALPLHRCREMGCQNRIVDLIDERKLTPQEMRELCLVILGAKPESLPDPTISLRAFSKALETELKNHRLQWDPIKKKMKPWIDIKALNQMYGKGLLRHFV
mmetsp:Transcript_4032/g.7754  ORF Transcript_4032/g.7754 Transcript_4032/m.7754 type:complete len:369 (+) Transcript_4032:186-1292(+)